MGITYASGVSLAKLCFSAFAKWEVEAKESVPPRGPLIVVSNHLSNADPPFLVASIPRRLHFMGKRSLFANPVASSFLTAVGVHPLDRDSVGVDAIRWNLELLKRDAAIALFPEGTRSGGEGMKKAHPGVAYLAAKSQAPILPVAITGTEKVGGYWQIPFPLCHVKIRIGQPFSLPVMEGKLSRPILEHLTDMIMQRIADMLPEGYRGVYGPTEAMSTVGLDF